jgi:hypothetical protein
VGDINRDGRTDVVVANTYGANELYLGNAAGGLTRQTTGGLVTGTAASYGVAMGDINNDGRADVVVANNGAANELYLGNAAGGLMVAVIILWWSTPSSLAGGLSLPAACQSVLLSLMP